LTLLVLPTFAAKAVRRCGGAAVRRRKEEDQAD